MMKSMEGSFNGLLHDPAENHTSEASHQNTFDGRTVFHSKPDTVIQTKAVHNEKHFADPASDNQSTEHKSGPSGVNGATTDNETDHENVGSSETKDVQRFDSQSFVGRLMVNSILVTRELNGVLSEKISIYDPIVGYLGSTLRYANDWFQESVKSAAQKADDIGKEANLAARTAKDYCETEEEECVSVVNQLKTAPLKVLNTLVTKVEKISKALLLKNGKVGSIQLKPGCKEVYSVAVDPALKLIGSQTEFVLKLLNGISTKEKKLTELNKLRISASLVIQKWWREVLSEKQRQRWNSAAVTLQKFWRGKKARTLKKQLMHQRELKQKELCAIIIQRAFRIHCTGRHSAAIIIQRVWIQYCIRQQFLETKHVVIKIQSFVRMYQCKKRFAILREKVILIQRKIKANRERRIQRENYVRIRKSAIIIQRFWRNIESRRRQERLELENNAATTIQNFMKMVKNRLIFKSTVESIVIIQTYWRSAKHKKLFYTKKSSAIVIQRFWRNYVNMKEIRHNFFATQRATICLQSSFRIWKAQREYLKKKRAILCLQAAARGWKVRIEANKKKMACIMIQSHWRMFVLWKKYNQRKQACLTLQKYGKAYLTMIPVREKFIATRNAAITLQSHFRRYAAQSVFRKQKHAAITLQSHFRRYAVQSRFRKQKHAAITLQSHFRRYAIQSRFRKQKHAAVTLQCHFRRYAAQSLFRKQKNAAITLQSHFRRYAAQSLFREKQHAAITLQSCFRRYAAQSLFKEKKSAMVILQSHFRRYAAQSFFRKQKNAAITLQSHFRGYAAQSLFGKQKNAAITLQSHFRRYAAQSLFRKQKNAAITLQSHFRVYAAQSLFRKQKNAAITLQSHFRRYAAQSLFRKKNNAAITLQSHFRRYAAQSLFTKQRNAAIILQSHVRRFVVQSLIEQQSNAALIIQKNFRSYYQRRQYLLVKEAIVTIQRNFRAKIMRSTIERLHKSAIIIQRWWRGQVLTLYAQENFHIKREAAITVQRYFRLWKVHKAHCNTEAAALTIQTCWRRYCKQNEYQSLLTSTVVIQKWWRSVLLTRRQRHLYLYIQGCIIMIQAFGRGKLARQSFANYVAAVEFEERNNAATVIQSWYRNLIRLRLEQYKIIHQKIIAAAKIQCWYRALVQRRNFCKQDAAVKTIQLYWRTTYGMLIDREYFIYLRRAAIIFQSAWRARVARIETTRIRAAIVIQSAFRDFLVAKRQRAEQRQLYINAFVDSSRMHLAAIKIQRSFRKYQYLNLNINAVVKIQSFARMAIQRIRFNRLKSSAITIQRAWKASMARNAEIKVHDAATRIQALWRGYKVRKQNEETLKRLSIIRINVTKANKNAIKMDPIGKKTDKAIKSLLQNDTKQMLKSMMTLEASLRLSPLCCEKVTSSNCLPQLLNLIRGLNRSVPHLQILNFAIRVFVHLAKYPKTAPQVHSLKGLIPVVIDHMAGFHDIWSSYTNIFSAYCLFLYIMASTNPHNKDVFTTSVMEFLKSKKTRLMKKVVNQGGATKKKGGPKLHQALPPSKWPVIEPAWCLKPGCFEFDNPLTALSTLIECLEQKDETNESANTNV